MSITANIHFQKTEYSMGHDGHPDSVIPYLKKLVEEAKQAASDHETFFSEEMWVKLQRESMEQVLTTGAFTNPNFEYRITDKGNIMMLSTDGETWLDLDCLKEDYQTILTAVELDDVDCSLSTMHARNQRMGEIQDSLPGTIIEEWEKEVQKRLEDPGTTMASGARYN